MIPQRFLIEKTLRDFATKKADLTEVAIKQSLIGSRITGIEIIPIPRTTHMYRLVLTTDAKPVEIGNGRYNLSMMVLKVKL